VQPGDQIIVQMDNGTQYTYRVFRKQRYDVSNMPMAELIWPSNKPADKEWITLITCGGNFVPTQSNGLGEYTQRDVVVAERVQ
jgi:sortase (surface protein transpeptidase)